MGVLVFWGATGAHRCFAFFSRLLHAEEPSAPVEEDDSNLDKETRVGLQTEEMGEAKGRTGLESKFLFFFLSFASVISGFLKGM